MSKGNESTTMSIEHLYDFSSLYKGNDTNINWTNYHFDIWEEYLRPTVFEIIVICLYIIVFFTSLIGNSLIIVYILRRRYLQTVVNCLMLNLTVADFLVTIICLPPTLMVDVFETWLLGNGLCTLVPYLQMTVMSVSSLSLGAIAINRWFVVCRPLKVTGLHKSPFAAKVYMVLVWAYSLITLCPIAFVIKLTPSFGDYEELAFLKSCTEKWHSFDSQAIFHGYYLIVCYALPLVVLAITYTMVFRNLSTSKIPDFDSKNTGNNKLLFKRYTCSHYVQTNSSTKSNQSEEKKDYTTTELNKNQNLKRPLKQKDVEYNYEMVEEKSGKLRLSERLKRKFSSKKICRKCRTRINLLRSRRRSAFMQVTLIIVFAICFAPALILDILRQSFGNLRSVDRQTIHSVFSVAHLLLYINSALNPIIYNFFSVHFRNEFKSTFRCSRPNKKNRSTPRARSTLHQSSRWDYASSKSREGAVAKGIMCCTVQLI